MMRIMVDTVKLLLQISNPKLLGRGAFSPLTVDELIKSHGTARTYLNPSPTYAKMGKYMPRLTLHRRPAKTFGIVYQLVIEFSAPKLLYGNNFDELTDNDFEQLLTSLQGKLQELLGYTFTRSQLAQADVGSWHPSKNIVFLNYTACQTVMSAINKLDVSRIYDFQKDRYRDGGHVLHIHCNSLDIAFYDKMADLRKAKVSDKRAFEDNSLMQLSLLDKLEEYKPLEVLRYEVRFVGRQSVKRAFPELESWTFESLYSMKLCQAVLQKHWQRLSASVDMLSLDVKQPFELLQNYLEENHDVTPQGALMAVAGLLVVNQVGASDLKSLLEARFGKQVWYRLRKQLVMPSSSRFTYFIHIDEALEKFIPINMKNFV